MAQVEFWTLLWPGFGRNRPVDHDGPALPADAQSAGEGVDSAQKPGQRPLPKGWPVIPQAALDPLRESLGAVAERDHYDGPPLHEGEAVGRMSCTGCSRHHFTDFFRSEGPGNPLCQACRRAHSR